MNLFDSIIGYDGVKNEMYQIIDMFKNGSKYEKIGARFPKGLMIYGDPGMGKTMLANAVIEECDVKTYKIVNNKSTQDLIKEINCCFIEAKKLDNSIILFDDLDKFSSDDGNKEKKIFACIQSNIDSVKNKNILVIATVNDIGEIPRSLKRNGRFDRKIELRCPNVKDSERIVEYYLKKKRIKSELNLEDVCKMINYTSCADLETILNESAILAAYDNREEIEIKDIVNAHLRDAYDFPKENYECSRETIEMTAMHEAGHVVIAEVLKKGCVGFAALRTFDEDAMDGFTHLCLELKRRPENVLVALGGKIACELFYEGRCASGAHSDLSKALDLVRYGISDSGTCGLGMIVTSSMRYDTLSDNFKSRNEAAAIAEIEKFMFLGKNILLKNKEFLFKVAKELNEKRTLLYSDIKRIRDSVDIIPIELP